MTFAQFVFHAANFFLPVLVMALLMPLAGRLVIGTSRVPMARRMRYHAAMAAAIVVAGLVVQGRDGGMATYWLMVLLAATLEWVLQRGRRR